MKDASRKEMRRAAEAGESISSEIALEILNSGPEEMPEIMACATLVRRRYFGDKLLMCSIMNAKSGACSEDCAFCAQSGHHRTDAKITALAEIDEIKAAYISATDYPVSHFGVVTSGKALKARDVEQICDAARRTRVPNLNWCASLGCLEKEQLLALKDAGFKRFHHNLETSESYFPKICTTHSYSVRIDTLRSVKEAGLEVCSGGIMGLGESLEQRVEFAEILLSEEVDSIPLNYLIPIPGTRLESLEVMKPLDMLRSIAMFRMKVPKSELKVCAGRIHLRDLQSMVFYAGATGIMVGDLLTVAGRNPKQDIQMIEDLGFSIR